MIAAATQQRGISNVAILTSNLTLAAKPSLAFQALSFGHGHGDKVSQALIGLIRIKEQTREDKAGKGEQEKTSLLRMCVRELITQSESLITFN